MSLVAGSGSVWSNYLAHLRRVALVEQGRIGMARWQLGRFPAGHQGRCPGCGIGRSECGDRPAIGNGQGNGRQVDAGRWKRRLGTGGRVPRRVDAATKSALLELLEKAVEQGWSVSAAAVVLDLGRVRAHRWMLKSPEKGARTSICLATSPDVAHVTGSTSIDARHQTEPGRRPDSS